MSEAEAKNRNVSEGQPVEKLKEKDGKPVEVPEAVDESDCMPPEMLKMPPEVREYVQSYFSMQSYGPTPNPIDKKLTSEHIGKIIDINAEQDKRAYNSAGSARRYTFGYVILLVALFIFITLFLVDTDKALYKEVLKFLVVFGGGFGAGFGLNSQLDKRK